MKRFISEKPRELDEHNIMANRKTVLISGSSRGIGQATAELFAQRGWNVVAHARQPSAEFDAFLRKLSNGHGVTVTPVYFDMRDEVAMREQVQRVVFKSKMAVDALINNAGITEIKLFLLTSVASIREIFDVNLFSHMQLTRLILPRMPKKGAIINVASISGIYPKRGLTSYAASKAAMIAWTEVLSKELAGRIRVNAVAPYNVNTDMTRDLSDKIPEEIDSFMEPSNIAKAIYFLCSDDAEDITGEVLKITGTQAK